jgi:Tfp pilus assembly protein PilE
MFLRDLSAARLQHVRAGFSAIEAVVIIGIVLVLLAISIPVVRDMRSLTRRSNCDQNLVRLAMASQAYRDDFGHLPSGSLTFNANLLSSGAEEESKATTVIRSLPEGYHHNWISSLLPYLDRQGLFQSIEFDYGVYSDANRLPREVDLALLRCPAAGETQLVNTTSYVGLHDDQSVPIAQDNSGLWMVNRWITSDDVLDGEGYTVLFGEKISPPDYDLSWMSGTRSSLRNAGTPINAEVAVEAYRDPLFVGGLASHHAGGATVAMADASVRFLSETIEQTIFQKMVRRDDGVESSDDRP